MPAFNYGRSVATAKRLITRYGQKGILRTPGRNVGPAFAPNMNPPEDHDATFAIVAYDSAEIDGSRVLATDERALISPTVDVAPTTSHKLVDADGRAYTIVDVKRLRPATTTVYYDAQVRRMTLNGKT